jgi:hypothetical protein
MRWKRDSRRSGAGGKESPPAPTPQKRGHSHAATHPKNAGSARLRPSTAGPPPAQPRPTGATKNVPPRPNPLTPNPKKRRECEAPSEHRSSGNRNQPLRRATQPQPTAKPIAHPVIDSASPFEFTSSADENPSSAHRSATRPRARSGARTEPRTPGSKKGSFWFSLCPLFWVSRKTRMTPFLGVLFWVSPFGSRLELDLVLRHHLPANLG